MFSKKVMILSWYIKELGDWLYSKGLGDCDYTSPSHCKHCNKWNFEE